MCSLTIWADHIKLWNVLRKMGIPEHLIVLMGNLKYTGQEASVQMEHGETEYLFMETRLEGEGS